MLRVILWRACSPFPSFMLELYHTTSSITSGKDFWLKPVYASPSGLKPNGLPQAKAPFCYAHPGRCIHGRQWIRGMSMRICASMKTKLPARVTQMTQVTPLVHTHWRRLCGIVPECAMGAIESSYPQGDDDV